MTTTAPINRRWLVTAPSERGTRVAVAGASTEYDAWHLPEFAGAGVDAVRRGRIHHTDTQPMGFDDDRDSLTGDWAKVSCPECLSLERQDYVYDTLTAVTASLSGRSVEQVRRSMDAYAKAFR